ncbi:MAG: capsular biosynthesis protein [Bacteroidales bacterium]|nr:capsular biosynthesis protein [Bacteroidales bacterium]
MLFFSKKYSIAESGLLKGITDNHSHILPGVDDGADSLEKSLSIMSYLEGEGISELWLTPHIMEDVPNTSEALKERYDSFRKDYTGPIRLHLAAEYMIDTLYEERLEAHDILTHGEDVVLLETSANTPPVNLWDIVERTMREGYRPIMAHPERYCYMSPNDYKRLKEMGCLFQLNLPSIAGAYGEHVQRRAEDILAKGMYDMAGSDCHRLSFTEHYYRAAVLKAKTIAQLKELAAKVQ